MSSQSISMNIDYLEYGIRRAVQPYDAIITYSTILHSCTRMAELQKDALGPSLC